MTIATEEAVVAHIGHAPGRRQPLDSPVLLPRDRRQLDDLRRRIDATRLPEKETGSDTLQGVPLATVQKLARYWATEYDWRKCRGAG